MSSDKFLIFHSFPSWDAPYIKSTIELVKNLDCKETILFFDYPYTWKDFFVRDYLSKSRLLGLSSRSREFRNNFGAKIVVISLPVIFPERMFKSKYLNNLLKFINSKIIQSFIKKTIRKRGAFNQVVINCLNPMYGLRFTQCFNPSKTIYYCYDNIDSMQWAKEYMSKYEKEFAAEVDHVITTSSQLKHKLSKYNSNVSIVNNGVNTKIFNRNSPRKKEKYIDYLGAIDDRMDLELLLHLAQALPDFIIRCIGPDNQQLLKDIGARNIRHVPPLEQKEAVDLMLSASVCIIPFLLNEFTKFIYPLKINEYLALGKPVVTTDFADLSTFEGMISIASSKEAFAQSTIWEIESDDDQRISKRIEFAFKNSWESRASQLLSVVHSI